MRNGSEWMINAREQSLPPVRTRYPGFEPDGAYFRKRLQAAIRACLGALSTVVPYPEGMVRLNHSAGEILILVDGERSVGQLIEALSERFPEVPEIDQDIFAFLEAAHAEHWIEYF